MRRFVRHKERDETVELGRKIYDEIVERLPAELDKDALKRALKKLKIENEDELMVAIARKRISDEALMEALMPGSAGGDVAPRPLGQRKAISIKGLTPGVAYHLANCCHPIPGDRIVGLRREDEEIEVHVIGCDTLASGIDADWLDLAWGEGSDGGAARLAVILRDVPGRAGHDVGHPRRQARQHHQLAAGPSRRQLPDLPPGRRSARSGAPPRDHRRAARRRPGQLSVERI